MTYVYKEYEVKTKMVQEQWLRFLLGYFMKNGVKREKTNVW